MGFRDYREAKRFYSLTFSDVGKKLNKLTSMEGKWNWGEIEDNRYKRKLEKAFENLTGTQGTLAVFDATETTRRMFDVDKANKNPTINALGIESAPNRGLGAALVNQTQQKIMGMPQPQNAADGNVLAINQPINSVTNNTSNTVQGRGDSRINEPALNQSRNDDRGGLMF